ncbi:MAG: alpha/beta hydrolase family protein, partial [Opitutaceae bacterium]
GEGIESTTRMFPGWFAPQLRFFAGREDRLPVDANLLIALIAPRACLLQYGQNDEVSNVWANEQAYFSARKVYAALGQADRLGVLRVPGFHGANDVELCLDWLDAQFGRSRRPWRNDLLFPWDHAEWAARHAPGGATGPLPPPPGVSARRDDVARNAALTRDAVTWLVGRSPPTMAPGGTRGGRGPAATPTRPVPNPGQLAPDVPAWVIARSSQEFGWSEPHRSAADSRRVRFGSGMTGDLYFPARAGVDRKLPAVIWLHGHSYPLGYMWVYRRDVHPILALVKAGFAVLAFDQCGYGSRMAEIGPFYDRTPAWSQLGRMIEDVRSALDALEKEPGIDGRRVSLFGYSVGAMVALHAAALDARIARVVAVSGFTPMRTDTADRPTGGLARFSHERPLVPRLGLFLGREQDVPYDYGDLLAAIAPRPVYVVQPTMDRDAHPAEVREAVRRARDAYALVGAEGGLVLDEPQDYQRLTNPIQDRAIAWLSQLTP